MNPKLTVLSREYCHLCEELITALKQFHKHPRLEEKWGDKVPVLLDGDLEICHYYLDVEAVDTRLARMR